MHLAAISTGYAIPHTDFDATIHSVFRTAVNLQPVNSDFLLTLVVAGEADLPQGIRLDTPAGFYFEKLNAGSGVFFRNSAIVFDNSSLEVNFCQARLWQCDLPSLSTDLTNPAVSYAWKRVWKSLNEQQVRLGAEIVAQALLRPGGRVQSAVSRRVGEVIRDLTVTIRRYQWDAPTVLTRLIGLGTGLTPSGDDFLVGYLAGLWCTILDSVDRKQYVSKLGQAVSNISWQTNDISRTYLYHAAQGQVSSRLEALARAISRGESTEQLLPVAVSAMQSGHTSGMDTVTGLLLGLAA